MARSCTIMKHFVQKGNKISIERSKVTKRTKKIFQLNLKNKNFKTKLIGNFNSIISNKTLKTINKYEDIESYEKRLEKIGLIAKFVDMFFTPVEKALVLLKRGQLTEWANKKRKTLISSARKMQIQLVSANKI